MADLLSIRESIAQAIEARTEVDTLVRLVADNIDIASRGYPTASRFCFLDKLGRSLGQKADDFMESTRDDDYRGGD